MLQVVIAVTAVVSETIISRFNHTIHDLPEEVQIVGSNDHCTLVLPQSFLFSPTQEENLMVKHFSFKVALPQKSLDVIQPPIIHSLFNSLKNCFLLIQSLSPDMALCVPISILRSVLLLHPFGPTTPSFSPRSTRSSAFSNSTS